MKVKRMLFNQQNYPYAIIGVLFFIYVFVRSISVGATFDEVDTINYFVHTWVYGVEPVIANNHFLNTFLINLFSFFFGDSLFVARLPNVLAFLVYAFFSYKIVSKYLPNFVGVACFFLLFCNPFLLDFFSLARGYGLSFACMIAALYYSVENFKQYSNTSLIKSLIWAAASVFALFSMIYFFCTLAFAMNLVLFLRKDFFNLKKSILRTIIVGFGLLLLIIHPILQLVERDQLYHGGSWNFFEDTMFSLTRYSLFHVDTHLFTYIVLTLGLFIFSLIVFISIYRRREFLSLRNFILFVLAMIVTMILIAHYTAGILYPIDRNTLFFYPLIVFAFCFCLPGLKSRFSNIVMSVTLIACILNFSLSANLYKTVLWHVESHNREILHKINEIGKELNRVMNIECHFVFLSSLQYYQKIDKCSFTNISVVQRNEANKVLSPNTDFYFHDMKDDKQAKSDLTLDLSKYDKEVFISYPKDNFTVYTISIKK